MLEWLGMLFYTREAAWTADDRRMMTAATTHHLVRAGALLALIAALLVTAYLIREKLRGETLLSNALIADFRKLAVMLPELDNRRDALARDSKRSRPPRPPRAGIAKWP